MMSDSHTRRSHVGSSGLFASATLVAALAACDPSLEGPDADFRGIDDATEAHEGEFATRIADNLDGSSRTFHVLKREGSATEVRLPEGVVIDRGAVVRAWGDVAEDGVLDVDHFEVVVSAPVTERDIDPEPRAPRRIAMVTVFWPGSGGLANAEAKSKLFTGSTSTANYYREVSYGREKLTGEVFGPYEIPHPGSCNPDAIALAARKAIKDHGHPNVEADYEQFMYHFPGMQDCGFSGLAEVGIPEAPARDTWYNGSSGCVVLAQEIGHNYGMGHSHSYDCVLNGEDAPFSEDCSFEEYGHPYDPMGHACGHMNQIQKGYMGWLGECNSVTATSDGVFNIVPTELPCNGTQTLRFATAEGRYYYLEYRQPLGQFDDPSPSWSSGLSGVLVHVAGEFDKMFGPKNYILDMQDGPGAFMHAGEEYIGYDGEVTVTVLAEYATHAVVQIEFPGGGSGNPRCHDDSVPVQEMAAWGTLECAEEPLGPDLVGPTVSIVYPEDGQVIPPGSSFDILAEGEDDDGVVDMLLYVNGEPQYKIFGEPWEWPVTGIPEGTYELGVLASDGPNQTPSLPIYITVGEEEVEPEDTGDETEGEESDDGGTSETDGAGAGASDDKGCGCRQTPPPRGTGILVLGALGLGLGWRRRFGR